MGDAIRIGPVGEPAQTLFPIQQEWCRRWLRQPDGPEAGRPWEFTPEQAHFLAWWYAYDERGRWLYRRGTLRRMKGWGKDPLGAVICAIEAVGPCRITHRKGGLGYGPNPGAWVQVAAVSRDQTRTTMRLFPGLFPKETREHYGIEVHKEIVHIDGGRRVIEAITTSPLSAEGPRPSFVLRNEIQNWIKANDGHDMAEVIDGNLAKSRDGSARALSLCNAHVPGLDSVGEREWDAWQAIDQGRSKGTGVLYDSVEAPADTDLADETSLRRGLAASRGDSIWLEIDRLVAEVWDPRTPPSESRRKYLNQIVAAEDAWCAPQEWDALEDPTVKLQPGDQIALGFDGSKTDDHTALIGARISDGAWLSLGVWDPTEHGGEAPRDLIDGTVDQVFGQADVVAFFGDLEGWESYVDKWADKYGQKLCVKASLRHAIAWDMRGRHKEFTLDGAMRVHDEITEGVKALAEGRVPPFRHDVNARVRQHIHNARRRPNAWGVSFGKEHRESLRKVDALPAGCLARMARRAYLALPASRQRRKRTGRAVFV
jgi:bifunctional DNA-binding transcriptional regulator/antitoxin component of YhaV-PrlF toxin-antitoxin module